MWMAPVIDRTLVDVINGTAKGKLDHDDLNRIEGNIEALSSLLVSYGYSISVTSKENWAITDFPYAAQMARIITNVNALINGYYSQSVEIPPTLQYSTYVMLNDLENVLKLMYEMIERMVASFFYSGEMYAGEGW